MLLSTETFLIIGSIVIFVGILLGKVGARFGVPALLLFLLTGMLFGVDGIGIQFSNMRGVQSIGIVALSIILFSGGMGTKLSQIRPVIGEGIALSTIGVLLTTLFTGLLIFCVTHYLFPSLTFSLPISILLAATMSSTDSASVFAILRSQRVHLKENLKPLLELESGSNDPMAYMITVALIGFVMGGETSLWSVAGSLVLQFLFGIIGGFLFGWLCVKMLNNLNIQNEVLYPIALLCLVMITYVSTWYIGGNGYLAVYIAGIYLGNSKITARRSVYGFFDGITWLVQIVLFIMLGLLVNPSDMLPVLLPTLIIAVLMMFIARPLACFVTLLPFRQLSFKARLFTSWVGLRGAAPILFATYPVLAEVPQSNHIFTIVFVITLVSLICQGMTITPVARALHLAEPAPPEGYFMGVEIPEETNTSMEERIVVEEMLTEGHLLKDLALNPDELVILVRRHDRYIVPKGGLHLHPNDILLIVSERNESEREYLEIPNADLFTRLRKTLGQVTSPKSKKRSDS